MSSKARKEDLDVLANLPNEVKNLVNSGAYTLYAVGPVDAVNFVLETDPKSFYLLTRQGDAIKRADDISEYKLEKVITFPELSAPRKSLKVNFAV